MRKRYIYTGLILFSIVSISGNIYLVNKCLEYYRRDCLVRLDPGGCRYYYEDNSNLKKDAPYPKRIVYFGDSRIFQWQTLPEVNNADSINRGISNQTTGQLLLRLDEDVLKLNPSVVVLQIGINDLKMIGVFPDKRKEIFSICSENISRIVKQLKGTGIDVVVLTVFPPGKPDLQRVPIWNEDVYSAVEQLNEYIKTFKSEGVYVIDTGVLSQGNRINPKYAHDTLHLNADGYKKLNELVGPFLNKLKSK